MFERKITLGGSRRREGLSKKKIYWGIFLVLIIFLSIWQMPIKQNQISKDIDLPKPTEIK